MCCVLAAFLLISLCTSIWKIVRINTVFESPLSVVRNDNLGSYASARRHVACWTLADWAKLFANPAKYFCTKNWRLTCPTQRVCHKSFTVISLPNIHPERADHSLYCTGKKLLRIFIRCMYLPIWLNYTTFIVCILFLKSLIKIIT